VQKAYGIADFSIGINDNNGHYKVTAFVDNALDKRYANGVGNTTSGFSGVPGALGSTWSLLATRSATTVALRREASDSLTTDPAARERRWARGDVSVLAPHMRARRPVR